MRDIEHIIRSIKVRHPGADDDGLWFFRQPESPFGVQIESAVGMCPFLVETDETPDRRITNSVAETVHAIEVLLDLPAIASPGD